MMKPCITKTLTVVSIMAWLLCFVTQVQANSDFNLASGNQLKTTISSEYGYIDNFLLTPHDKESTSYFKVNPSMFMQAQFERMLLQVDAKIDHYQYQNFSEDDHTSYHLSPKLYYKLDLNKTAYIKAKSEEVFESRGSELTLGNAGAAESGDKKDVTGIAGGYLYGSENSVAKLAINLSSENEQYNTRREETYVLDNDEYQINTSFDYLLSGKTYLAFDIGYTKIDYDNDSSRNEEELLALMGVKWEVSAVTKLDVLLGYQEITFDDATVEEDGSFKWRVNFDWQPTYSTKINFISERGFEDANRLSNSYRVSDIYKLGLKQNFTDYFNLTADISYSEDSIFTETIEDSEEYLSTNMKFLYSRKQWLHFFAEYKYQELESNDLNAEYQQHQFGLGVQISL